MLARVAAERATVLSVGPSTSGTFEGSVDWTPDIWGKIRRQVQGDVAAAQVSAADLANATLSEQGLLAADYVDLRASDALIALFKADRGGGPAALADHREPVQCRGRARRPT